MAAKHSHDYQTLSLALDTVLAQLQQPDIQVDQAVKLYEEGLKLIAQLEGYLEQATNTIEKLKLTTIQQEQ